MSDTISIVLAQLNPLVGDVSGNAAKILACVKQHKQADLIVFPELMLTGYLPEDLLLRPDFIQQAEDTLHAIRRKIKKTPVLIGHPHRVYEKLYNAASLLHEGEIKATYLKHCLPNYGVFDEKRYFTAGDQACVIDIEGMPVGITICEDMWEVEPTQCAQRAGAKLIVSLNASPYELSKKEQRLDIARQRIKECGLPLIYVNMVGGQDELVFDGGSFALSAAGELAWRAPTFTEDSYTVEVHYNKEQATILPQVITDTLSDEASIYQALVMGVRDYVKKNNFPGAVLGLSGGIDSALVAAIAADALGPEHVQVVCMPSRYTAEMSIEDAMAEAEALGIKASQINIEQIFKTYIASLSDEFAGYAPDKTEENLQARIRGALLMAISNKTGKLVLTTGNKSEMAVGYATLYGDMAGGFAVLKDVSKTWVYKLSRYRNQLSQVIPDRVITRPPTAELAENQLDSDSLPAYDVLDPMLERYIEQDMSPAQLIEEGFAKVDVQRVIRLVDLSEYKRRQAPPGVRITSRAFGRERRYPITSFKG